jgi:hypothetical protein
MDVNNNNMNNGAAAAAAAAEAAAVAVAADRGDAQPPPPPAPTDDEGVHVKAETFRDAADHLEALTGRPIRRLIIEEAAGVEEWNAAVAAGRGGGGNNNNNNDNRDNRDRGDGGEIDDDDDRDQQRRMGFVRFVAALCRRDNVRAVREIVFVYVTFRTTPEEGTDALFGEGLPSHPTLEAISFAACTISAQQMERFASSVPAGRGPGTRLAELEFEDCPLDRGGYMALAAMIRRNVPLAKLAVYGMDGGLDHDACRRICQSVPHNRHLRALDLYPVTELLPGTPGRGGGAVVACPGPWAAGLHPHDGREPGRPRARAENEHHPDPSRSHRCRRGSSSGEPPQSVPAHRGGLGSGQLHAAGGGLVPRVRRQP